MFTSTRLLQSRRCNPHSDEREQGSLNKKCESSRPRRRLLFICPSGNILFSWLGIVSLICTYNTIVISYRISFAEINEETKWIWFFFDYSADFIYLLDIFISCHVAFYDDEGILQTKTRRIYSRYVNSTLFYLDLLSLLPLDFLYISFGYITYVRIFRLVKFYKLCLFVDRLERHTNYVNVVRSLKVIYYLLLFLHLNSCLYNKILMTNSQKTTSSMNATQRYLDAVVWAVQTLTLMENSGGGKLSTIKVHDSSNHIRVFFILETIISFLLFATVIGSVNNIVAHANADRKDFQYRLDRIKHFLMRRDVPELLNDKVIQWFDYLWMSKNSINEEKITRCLPDKLKAEIAIHVHLNTLKRVEIFQNTEDGFLSELVVRLKSQLFSPGDYICRKGEVGKQMFIVSKGRLQVLGEDEVTVVVTLKAGGYFGEISILNISNQGNRRTASVRSVGFSDLYCLSKTDLWDVLKDYPNERAKLELVAQKRLEKIKESRQTRNTSDLQDILPINLKGEENRNSSESICSDISNETYHNLKKLYQGNYSRMRVSNACSDYQPTLENVKQIRTKSYQMLHRLPRDSSCQDYPYPQNRMVRSVQIHSTLNPGRSCLDFERSPSAASTSRQHNYCYHQVNRERNRGKRESLPNPVTIETASCITNSMLTNWDAQSTISRRQASNSNNNNADSHHHVIPEIRFQGSSNFGSFLRIPSGQDKDDIALQEKYRVMDELRQRIDLLTLENERLRQEMDRLDFPKSPPVINDEFELSTTNCNLFQPTLTPTKPQNNPEELRE